MTLDLVKLRADTPACEDVLHFNNAGMSLMPAPVFEAVRAHQALEQKIGGYEAQDLAAPLIEAFYTGFADMIGAAPREIAFMESATRAWDAVFYSLPLQAGDRILMHASTYASNYMAVLQFAKRKGVEIDLVPSDAFGQIDVAALPTLIQPTTKLILLTHCPSQSGLIQPAAEVGAFAKQHGLIYLLDTCQSAGQMPLNVELLGCHALTGTGRKFLRGPRGAGFLYVSQALSEMIEPSVVDIKSADWSAAHEYKFVEGARRFEMWERNVAGQIGLGRAVRYALDVGLENIATRIQSLASNLRSQLSEIDGVTVHDPGVFKSGIVTFSKAGVDVGFGKAHLRAQKINISTAPTSTIRLDAQARNLPDLMRASMHAYNNEAEVSRFVEVIAALK